MRSLCSYNPASRAPFGPSHGLARADTSRKTIQFACQIVGIAAIVILLTAAPVWAAAGDGLILFDSWDAGIKSTTGGDQGGILGDDINLGDVLGLPNSESVLFYALGVPYQGTGTGSIKIAYIDIGLKSVQNPTQDFTFNAVTFTTASPVRLEWDLKIQELQIQDRVGAIGDPRTNQISLVAGIDTFDFRIAMTQGGTRTTEDINLTLPYGGIEFRWGFAESFQLDLFFRLQPSFGGNTRGSNRELVAALKFLLSSGSGGGVWMLRVGFRSYAANLTIEKSSIDDFRFDTKLSGGFFGIEVRT
jgi:hypothetical protein